MASGREHVSAQHLARRADLTRDRQNLPKLESVLVVDDVSADADRIRATLSIIFGHDIKVRHARTLNSALDCVLDELPGVILLDDYLKPSDTALTSIPMIRRAGYDGAIVVVSGQLDRHRHRDLLAAGAKEAIHKDDLNSVRILETLNKVVAKLAVQD
ncbi:MAG: Response regulator receiver domain [Pseudomonadota bacterium]|jgi:DNA-binding NarL/FixJ family response regulator